MSVAMTSLAVHHECHEGRDDIIPKILDNNGLEFE